MMKLKKVINDLDDNTYTIILERLHKTKAENFLFLLQAYKKKTIADEVIMQKLDLKKNSFYVLKSRLYEKIQCNLSSEIDITREDVLCQFHQLPEICFSVSREVANAILLKIEKDLLRFELHNELVILYSILKRVNLYSEKYFHYSQLFNKQIAYNLAVEKSLDLLGEFNRKLNEYIFSRIPELMNELLFLHKEIEDYFILNSNKQIEIIKYFMELHLIIFCDQFKNKNTEDIIQKTHKLLSNLPTNSQLKKWTLALSYLQFEFYLLKGELEHAELHYQEVEKNSKFILLTNPICTASRFLLSKINYLIKTKRVEELKKINTDSFLFDSHDPYTSINISLYKSLILFFNNKIKEAMVHITDIINKNSFRDFIHINIEVKLILCYYYLHLHEFEIVATILKNLDRKLKARETLDYENVGDLIKFFNCVIAQGDFKVRTQKQKDYFALFLARNNREIEVIAYLMQDMSNKFDSFKKNK